MAGQMVFSAPDAGPLFLVTRFEQAFHAPYGRACLFRLPVRIRSTT